VSGPCSFTCLQSGVQGSVDFTISNVKNDSFHPPPYTHVCFKAEMLGFFEFIISPKKNAPEFAEKDSFSKNRGD